ncbi:MAG: hypothetical protein U0795_07020 [Pirellulales bacterium]
MGWIDRGWRRAVIAVVLSVTVAGSGAGCSRAKREADPDTKALENLVYDISDIALDARRFNGQFVDKGAPPGDQRVKYRDYVYKLAAAPEVTGDEAKLSVLVCDAQGEHPVTWTATKTSSGWRLKTAPLK